MQKEKKKLNILVIPNDVKSGCFWYRTFIPCKYLEKRGHKIKITQKIPVMREQKQKFNKNGVLKTNEELRVHPKDLEWADVIWFQRYYMDHPMPYIQMIQYAKENKKVIAYDLDDILDADKIPIYNPTGFQIARDSTQRLITYFLNNADVKTCASHALAEHYHMEYVPNNLDFELWDEAKEMPRKKHEKICVGFAGGASHIRDLKLIEPILQRFVDKGLIEVFLMGLPPVFDFEHKVAPFCPSKRYPYKLNKYGIDIGICPLEDISFNDYKSSVKWQEYSALGIPSIVSFKRPYNIVKNETTGFVCRDEKDWEKYLTLLIKNTKLRNRVGLQAYNKVKKMYDIEKNVEVWEKLFIDKFKQLNE